MTIVHFTFSSSSATSFSSFFEIDDAASALKKIKKNVREKKCKQIQRNRIEWLLEIPYLKLAAFHQSTLNFLV